MKTAMTMYLSATTWSTLLVLMPMYLGERIGMVTMVAASREAGMTASAAIAACPTIQTTQWILPRQITVVGLLVNVAMVIVAVLFLCRRKVEDAEGWRLQAEAETPWKKDGLWSDEVLGHIGARSIQESGARKAHSDHECVEVSADVQEGWM